MVHYLLLRFKENALTESIIDVFADKFESLEKQHEGIVRSIAISFRGKATWI